MFLLPWLQAQPPSKKSNWRAQHEEFVRNIRAARGVQAAIAAGGPLPPAPPPDANPGITKNPGIYPEQICPLIKCKFTTFHSTKMCKLYIFILNWENTWVIVMLFWEKMSPQPKNIA